MRVPSRLLTLCLVLLATLAPAIANAQDPDHGDVAHDSGLQWGFDVIRAEEAWVVGRGAGVTIAVIDSGVALDHEDLASKLVTGTACRNTDGDPDRCTGRPADQDGHGTHVAGIAAAVTDNGVGIAGVAPDARIMPIKVLFSPCADCPSAGNAEDVIAAIRWAVAHGAQVVNLSLGSTASSVFGPGFADALQEAWDAGAIPVVAAGNELVLTAELGAAPAVIVSATDRGDGAPEYSNGVGSARWAVAAPGGDGDDTASSCAEDGAPRGILSTYWANDDPTTAYACLSGTSMAAPHVSGALAILLSAGVSPSEAVTRLLDGAVDLGTPGPDEVFGAGRLDVAAAVAGLPRLDSRVPADATPGLATGEVSRPQLFDESSANGRPTLAIVLAVLLITTTAIGTAVAAGRADERRRQD